MSKSLLFKVCIIAGLFFFSQVSFASQPQQVPIPTDGSSDPGKIKPLSVEYVSASATISDIELAVYFDFSVGNAIISVYDLNNQLVFQEVVNTDFTVDKFIPVDAWQSGEYMLTVKYGNITQRGIFQIQ